MCVPRTMWVKGEDTSKFKLVVLARRLPSRVMMQTAVRMVMKGFLCPFGRPSCSCQLFGHIQKGQICPTVVVSPCQDTNLRASITGLEEPPWKLSHSSVILHTVARTFWHMLCWRLFALRPVLASHQLPWTLLLGWFILCDHFTGLKVNQRASRNVIFGYISEGVFGSYVEIFIWISRLSKK